MNRRLLLSVATFILAILIYGGVAQIFLAPIVQLPALPGGLSLLMLLLLIFSLLHAYYLLGWKHMLTFLVSSTVISLIYEEVGVATGAIFGAYHYTAVLGAQLGLVPILIPIAWFAMIYPSYVIANLITDGQPIGSRGSLGRVAWVALLSAIVMTTWDLLIDPVLSQPKIQAWVWDRPGSYFIIPIQNYVGWLLTTFTIYLVYRLIERRSPPQPVGAITNGIAALAIFAYVAMMFVAMLNGPSALIVIGPFSMGLLVVFALDRLFKRSSVT